MLGLLVILVISWGLLYFIEKEHIDVLGIVPNVNRVSQFFIGLVIITAIVLTNIYIETHIQQVTWRQNEYNYATLWNAFAYHLRSALTEDLVFRGAILYILMKRIGATKAIILSAAIFGMYHWFSYGILHERPILLSYVFLVTGFTGYVWAYTFHKTKSVLLALGLHTGYNLVMSCFYESQPYGEILFSTISKIDLIGWNKFYYSMFRGLFPPLAMFLCVHLLLKTKLYNRTSKENE